MRVVQFPFEVRRGEERVGAMMRQDTEGRRGDSEGKEGGLGACGRSGKDKRVGCGAAEG